MKPDGGTKGITRVPSSIIFRVVVGVGFGWPLGNNDLRSCITDKGEQGELDGKEVRILRWKT